MDLAFLKLIVQADEKGSISAAARHLGWLPRCIGDRQGPLAIKQWCRHPAMGLGGHGIALKAWIDVCEDVTAGRLVHVLPDFHSAPYPIVLIMSASLRLAARMRALGDCLAERFDSRLRAYPFPAVAEKARSTKGAGGPARDGQARGRRRRR
jgi:hypothetical protein